MSDDEQSNIEGGTFNEIKPGLNRRQFIAAVGAGSVAATLGSNTALAQSTPIYRIHPAIGVARLGNADPGTYFLGPEQPGVTVSGPFKAPGTDGVGRVRPQAVRYRIWEYARDANGVLTPVREVQLGQNGVTEIDWTVHVANHKAAWFEENGAEGETLAPGPLRNPSVGTGYNDPARQSLMTDFGAHTIHASAGTGATVAIQYDPSNTNQLFVRGSDGVTPVIDYHGQMRVDGNGRLIYIAGKGHTASNLAPAAPMSHWSNNNNWFDDMADGPVGATVTVNGQRVPMDPGVGNAWVLSAPPRFAPGIHPAISLYDTLSDMAVREMPIPKNSLYMAGGPLARVAQMNQVWPFGNGFTPDFESEILPILQAAVNYTYVSGLVNFKHGSMADPTLGDPSASAANARRGVFTYLRSPTDAAVNQPGSGGTMPLMYGDDWYQGNNLFSANFGNVGSGNAGGGGQTINHFPKYQRYMTLKPMQYALMQQWANGNFIGSSTPLASPAPSPFDFDRAVLENCIGGPFYPGIECSWQMRNPKLFAEPFRLMWDPDPTQPNAISQYLVDANLNIEGTPIAPGHFSRQMALPWQADFNDCVRLLNYTWWPSARPDDVFVNPTDTLNQRVPWSRPSGKYSNNYASISSHMDMVNSWYKYGFVELDTASGVYIESERYTGIIP